MRSRSLGNPSVLLIRPFQRRADRSTLPCMADLEASEFEGNGPHRWGGWDVVSARDKTRYMKRAERDPENDYDPEDPGERYLHGGVPEHTQPGLDWHKIP